MKCSCGFSMHISGFIRRGEDLYDIYLCNNPDCVVRYPVEVLQREEDKGIT